MNQEQEHYDHVMGEQDEFNNAYDAAKHEAIVSGRIGRDQEIDTLAKQGKHVVVYEYEVCCPITDALQGVRVRLMSAHDTAEEAEKAMAACKDQDDEGWYIIGGSKAETKVEVEVEALPF